MNNNYSHTIRLSKYLLLPLMAVTCEAVAQERAALEEVVVTAEHREASIQETQISISAFGAKELEELGISNGIDLGEHVPNLNAQPYVGGKSGVSYNIRGIGNAEVLVTFDPAVSVYIDGVLIPKNVGGMLDVLELERVEVLRGPQGTLYGRNTMGGAINYITRKPVDQFEARVDTTIGNYGQRDIRGMVNLLLLDAESPIGELNLRASAASLNRDGIQDNDFAAASQSELGTVDRDIALLHLMWRPTDNFSALYSYDRTRIDERPEAAWATIVDPSGNTPFLAAYSASESRRPSGISINGTQVAKTDVDGHALNLTWDITDSMSLHSLTGYREMENFSRSDSDGSPVTLLETRELQRFKSISQEFRLVGNTLDHRLDYSLGLFVFSEKGDVFNDFYMGGVGSQVNIINYETDAWALYGQMTYALTPKLDVTMGARYTEEDREMSKSFTFGVPYEDPIYLRQVRNDPALADTEFPKASRSFTNVSPMVSIGYQWNDDINTYFKVSSGYQSGGFNGRDTSPAEFVRGFDEETIISYELGLKSRFVERFQINAAAFFSDYDDKLVNQFDAATLSSVNRNAGVVEIWGLELEMLAQLTDEIRVGFNYGYVNKKYVEYDEEAPDGSIVDRSDSSNFPFSPDNTYSAFVAYEKALNFGVLSARLDWNYRDKMTFLVPQPERNSSKRAQLVNARIALSELAGPANSRIQVAAWSKNLLNEGYWNYGVNLYEVFGFDQNTYGEPRTYGLDLKIEF